MGDFVWHDLNRNGIQDIGEPGLDGVGIVLKDGSNAVLATTTISNGGFYQFRELCSVLTELLSSQPHSRLI